MKKENNLTLEEVSKWISEKCPFIWNLLNNNAKDHLPNGIREFLNSGSEMEIENGRIFFITIEKSLNQLSSKINRNEVANKYRREFSSLNLEKQVSELFAEISVCSAISTIAENISLKPITQGKKRADFRASISNYELFGEVKRYEDNWFINKIESTTPDTKRRSIVSSADEKRKQTTRIPRNLELHSKLMDVNKQLAINAINIIFLFHPSIGETVGYIKQTLFGESNFWNKRDRLILEDDSLFAKNEWGNISAFCLCRLGKNGLIDFYEIFKNPKTQYPLPDIVVDKMRNYL